MSDQVGNQNVGFLTSRLMKNQQHGIYAQQRPHALCSATRFTPKMQNINQVAHNCCACILQNTPLPRWCGQNRVSHKTITRWRTTLCHNRKSFLNLYYCIPFQKEINLHVCLALLCLVIVFSCYFSLRFHPSRSLQPSFKHGVYFPFTVIHFIYKLGVFGVIQVFRFTLFRLLFWRTPEFS